MLYRTVALIKILEKNGNLWTLENPERSFLFSMRSVRQLLQECYRVDLDQCMYGLRIPCSAPGELCKKATSIIGNFSSLDELRKRCNGRHKHCQAIGRVCLKGTWVTRSSLAGRYPSSLCSSLVAAAGRHV